VARSDEYNAVLDAMTTEPGASVAEAQNTMVEALKTAGVWSKLDVFYLFAQESNGDSEALINWVNPGTYDATNVHATSWTSLEGFTGDGANDYINTNYTPSTDATNYAQNDGSVGIYIRTNVRENSYDIGVNAVGVRTTLSPYRTDNKAYCRVNSGGDTVYELPVGSETSAGFWVVNRTASNDQDLFVDGSVVEQDTDASNGLPNIPILLLAYNNNGSADSFSTRQISLFFAASSMSGTEIGDFNDAIETYMDSNSKGVQ